MSKYAKLSAGLLAAWLVFSLFSSALHLYRNAPNTPPLALGLAVVTPIVLFLVWFASSQGFRQFVLSLSPRTLTLVQSMRIAGFVFLVLGTYKILPEFFALSAGWGDIAIGATASFAALRLANPAHRKGFIFWQVLGIADLVNALALGTLAGVIDPHGISTGAMTVLPMSYISTFAVPLFLILHIISIAQARRWPTTRFAATGNRLQHRCPRGKSDRWSRGSDELATGDHDGAGSRLPDLRPISVRIVKHDVLHGLKKQIRSQGALVFVVMGAWSVTLPLPG
ncbi:MAG: hypothetical protein WB799_18900 [Candidatus Sulfotelmatobacter sp.]